MLLQVGVAPTVARTAQLHHDTQNPTQNLANSGAPFTAEKNIILTPSNAA